MWIQIVKQYYPKKNRTAFEIQNHKRAWKFSNTNRIETEMPSIINFYPYSQQHELQSPENSSHNTKLQHMRPDGAYLNTHMIIDENPKLDGQN